MSKLVIFYVYKKSGNFKSYQIIEKTKEELEPILKTFNLKEGNPVLAHVVTNQHVIDAIIQKEDCDTVSVRVRDLKDELRDLSNDIESIRSSVDGLIRFVKGYEDE
jgi:3-deoxy-D-manno-octulosonate 8-phosphate phosphatase KdsC-like HAD superfamily phosphatase